MLNGDEQDALDRKFGDWISKKIHERLLEIGKASKETITNVSEMMDDVVKKDTGDLINFILKYYDVDTLSVTSLKVAVGNEVTLKGTCAQDDKKQDKGCFYQLF